MRTTVLPAKAWPGARSPRPGRSRPQAAGRKGARPPPSRRTRVWRRRPSPPRPGWRRAPRARPRARPQGSQTPRPGPARSCRRRSGCPGRRGRRPGGGFALLHGIDQVLDALVLKERQAAQLVLRQVHHVRGVAHDALLDQERGGLFGKALDVHGLPAGKVRELSHDLRGTVRICAEEVRAARREGRAARGTDRGDLNLPLVRLDLVRAAHDLGDDVVGAADEDHGVELGAFCARCRRRC